MSAGPAVVACLCYHDAPSAITFLRDALGFELGHMSEDEQGRIVHAELWRGDDVLMLGSDREDTPWNQAPGTGGTYVVLETDDAVDELFAASMRAGAVSVTEPETPEYGGRTCVIRDPEGNLWSLGTYRPERA
jgi:uncharacterized glyoxalase superfamily protein PhnB